MIENVVLSKGMTPGLGESIPRRVVDLVRFWSAATPDRPALREAGQTWSFSKLLEMLGQARTIFVRLGVRAGDRVMVVGENSSTLVAAFLALGELDAWPCIINPRLSERELDLIREHSAARCVVYCLAGSARARAHSARAGAVQMSDNDLAGAAVGNFEMAAVPEALEADPGARVVALVYTSGTTGLPKGVMLTHGNLLFTARVSGQLRGLSSSDHVYAVLPFSHSLGLAGVLLGTLYYGGTVHLTTRFDPAVTSTSIAQHELSVLLGTPSMFALMLEYSRAKGVTRLESGSLRLISSAGAPLDLTLKSAVEALFGMPLYNGYGVTECSPTVSQTRLGESREDCSVGRVLPGLTTRLLTPQGLQAAPGDVGELYVQGPNVMKGYYRDADATAAAVDVDGWFRTGDLARFEDDHLFIVGRAKELIIRFGFNVYPPEVEAVLNSHPAVMLSAVVGRPVKGDDEIVAFVQLSPGSTTTTKDLADHAARQLAPYKQPTEIRLIADMPVSAPGKIRKAELAKLAATFVASAS